jgi:hypothetical protein
MPMDTSLSAPPTKPAFGTSDFAGAPDEAREYIDATAEETCPAESAPIPEQHAANEAADTPSAASLEVMDQLKALAQNVTQSGRDPFDQSDPSSNETEEADAGAPGGSPTVEPSISVLPRPTGFENNQLAPDRPKSGSRVLVLAGLLGAAVIGAGGTFAWQTQLKSNDVAKAVAPAPAAPAPVVAPYVGRQLEDLAQDISALHHRMDELAAEQRRLIALQQQFEQLAVKQQTLATKQDQVGQNISKLQALEQARQRAPAPVQTRAAPVPLRPYVPPPPEPAMPPPPPRTASHPIPPMPVPP